MATPPAGPTPDDAVVASGGSASGGGPKLSSHLSHIPFDFSDFSVEGIEESHAWQEFSASGATLLSEDPNAAVKLLLRLVKEGDQRNREANSKIRHLQDLFDDVEHLRIRVARAEEGRLAGERSQHQIQTRLEMTEENVRELQYKSKEPEESSQKAALLEEIEERLSGMEEAVSKQPEWFASFKKRVVDLGDRFDRMDSRLIQVEAGPNGLKSKVAKTDIDLTAVEQLPRLMIQMMETQAKIEIHSAGVAAAEKSVAGLSQELEALRSELKTGSASPTKRPLPQVPIPIPLASSLQEPQLEGERAEEYQEAVEQFKQRVEELLRVESRIMRCEANLGRLTGNVADAQSVANIAKLKASQALDAAEMACTTASSTQTSMGRLVANVEEAFSVANNMGSKADTAVALARKAGRTSMDAQRLIEEQREKGYSLAAKLETAWVKVEKHEVSLLGCVTRIELEKALEASQRSSRRRVLLQQDEGGGPLLYRKMSAAAGDADSGPDSPQARVDRGLTSSPGGSDDYRKEGGVSFATLSRTNSQLQKDIGKVHDHLEFVTRQVMEVQQVMDVVASKEDVLQTRAQMAELQQELGDLDRRLTGRSVTEMDVRQAIETALDTFEERLKVAEQRGGKAEAQMRQAATKASQADDRIQEMSTHITALRRKITDLESDLNAKVDKAGVESTVMHHISNSMPTSLPDSGVDIPRGTSRRGVSHSTKAALIAMKQRVTNSKTRINIGTDARPAASAAGTDLGASLHTKRVLQPSTTDQKHDAGDSSSAEMAANTEDSPSKDIATIVNADTLLELVGLSESSMAAVTDMENRMKALQDTISVKADRNDVTALNKSLMLIQQDTLQITAKHVEDVMRQAQQERAKQSDMVQQSLESLRVDIGQLLQEMIMDDDTQHKKLKEVLEEMISLKAAAKDSKSEVESLRRAKFRTPIQLLFPDQYDGGSMITSVKLWAEQEIESLNKQMVSMRSTMNMKTTHDELAKVKDLVEETRRQVFTHATTTNFQASEMNGLRRKTERMISGVELMKKDLALVRTHVSSELLKVTVDTAQAIRDMENAQRQVKDISADVANLKRTVPQAVGVLRGAIKDLKTQANTKDAELESAVLSCSGRLKTVEKDITALGGPGQGSLRQASRGSGTTQQGRDSKLIGLESDMASVFHRVAAVEQGLSGTRSRLDETAGAIVHMVESLHAEDYGKDRFSAILQQLIEEESGREGTTGGSPQEAEMQVSGTGRVTPATTPEAPPGGREPGPIAESEQPWDVSKLGRKLKQIPQKANASWVMKLEAGLTSRLEELEQRINAVETTFGNLWQRKVDRSELQSLQRTVALQRADASKLKEIVADGLGGGGGGNSSVHAAHPKSKERTGASVQRGLPQFPGGFGMRKDHKTGREVSTAPSSPTPFLPEGSSWMNPQKHKLRDGGIHSAWRQADAAATSPQAYANSRKAGTGAPGQLRESNSELMAGKDAGRLARSLPHMPISQLKWESISR